MTDEVKQRKIEHVAIALEHDIAAPQQASWADVRLVHRALPEVDLDEIDTSVEFLGARLRYPIFISSLTGGHPDVAAINARLATIAGEYGLAMGVGSQRAALVTPALEETYSIVRATASSALLIANVGAPQLIEQQRHPAFTVEDARRAVAMIGARALAIHLNYLQEAAQPEGDRRARGSLAALRVIAAEVGVPVIAKETGAGIGYEQALALNAAGVSAIDVGGAGGSSMAAMESVRAQSRGDGRTAQIGQLFRGWGIATPIAVVETRLAAPGLPIISTGGVRSGLDAARALALGATLIGMGFPFLKAASESVEAVREFLDQFLTELRVAMQLTGAPSIAAMQQRPAVVTGQTREWLAARGFEDELRSMAQRGMRNPPPNQ
ncbi:MAG TPA: type 2 isopentenyl-diphosphate Delta-isomerase [Ktedonobacterales bacterium]|nr:type 2 isopentenyl-diphosphate Delta-isomerase [Ktedonobacterales bacterium]